MKKVLVVILIGVLITGLSGDGKNSSVNCESKVSDTKAIIESDLVLLKSLLKEVKDRQKELSELKLRKEKINEKLNVLKTVAEWLGLNKDQICGPTVTVPDPYLCTARKYDSFLIRQLEICKKGIDNGCGTISTFLQLKEYISKIKSAPGAGGAGSSFPPINISFTLPIGNVVVGGTSP